MMDHKPPPSPAASTHSDGFDGLPRGFDQLVQSADPTSYPREHAAAASASHLASQPGSRYGTPLPQSAYYEPPAPYPQGATFGYPQAYLDEPSPYGPLPGELVAHSMVSAGQKAERGNGKEKGARSKLTALGAS